jgi:hypothetical protein
MATSTDNGLRFAPSRVEGHPAVSDAVLFPDRLELLSANECFVVRFLDIARWHRREWLWRPLAYFGLLRGLPCVADRDWFHPPSGRFFRFYTEPTITVYLPDEPADLHYGQTMFNRIHTIIRAGGFSTFDLG